MKFSVHPSRHRALSVAAFALVVTSIAAFGSASVVSAATPSAPSMFMPVQPCRLLDTRLPAPPARIGAGREAVVSVAGRCGVGNDAVAAAITFTAITPNASGFLTAYPTGTTRPLTSAVNYGANDVVANHQFVRLGDDGSLSVYSLAATDVVVDVTGYFVAAPGGTAEQGRYVPVPSRRLADTRLTSRPRAGGSIVVDPGVSNDAVAVALNITTADASQLGHFTVYPAGTRRPGSSVLNVDRLGQTRAAAVVVPVSADGVAIYTSGANHIIVDVTGYFTGPAAATSSDGLFVSVAPERLIDSRASHGPSGGPRLWDGGTRDISVAELTEGGASAIATNVTVADTEDRGHVVAYPARTATPPTSTINYDRSQHTIANFALIGVSTRGIAVSAIEATDVIIDVAGWFTGSPVATTTSAPRNDPPPDRVVTIIGDSAMSGVRWNGALAGYQGFEARARLESCRRLVTYSCRGREGYAPRTTLGEIESLPPAGAEEILVIATGYNDWHERFSADFDLIIDAARRKGFHHIAWVDYRSSVGYKLPGSGGVRSNYGEMNRVLAEKLASGAFPDVRRWGLDGYTAATSGWFHSDGVHQTDLGSWGVADWISRHVRAFDGRPCAQPWASGSSVDNPCPDPDIAIQSRGYPDIAVLYGL